MKRRARHATKQFESSPRPSPSSTTLQPSACPTARFTTSSRYASMTPSPSGRPANDEYNHSPMRKYSSRVALGDLTRVGYAREYTS